MDSSVATATDTPQTIITLCNYEKYQRPFSAADTATDTPTDTPTNTKKKELKEKKDRAPKSEPEGFPDWYALYPIHYCIFNGMLRQIAAIAEREWCVMRRECAKI